MLNFISFLAGVLKYSIVEFTLIIIPLNFMCVPFLFCLDVFLDYMCVGVCLLNVCPFLLVCIVIRLRRINPNV